MYTGYIHRRFSTINRSLSSPAPGNSATRSKVCLSRLWCLTIWI